MSAQSPETQSKLAIFRQKAVDGTLTLEEQKEAIILLRADRKMAAAAPSAAGKKGSTAKPKAKLDDPDDALNELMGL